MPTNDAALCLPVDRWPAEDQRRWRLACKPASLFDDEGGELTGMRPASIRKYAKGYVRWSPKTGQGFKVGSPLMKDGSDDWQTQAVLG